MSDAFDKALARVQNKGGVNIDISPDPYSANINNGGSLGNIRVPDYTHVSNDMREDTGIPFSKVSTLQLDPMVDLTGIKTSNLDEEQRAALLETLIATNNKHLDAARELELENNKVDIENKKRFGKLGFWVATFGAGVVVIGLAAVLTTLIYGTLFDKQLIENNIIVGLLNTVVEMIRTIFSAV